FRLPLHWNAGISATRLLSTNALFYDRTANVYYQNKSNLKKTQLQSFTGFTYRIWKGEKASLMIGPQFQYSFTRMNKENTQKQHLFFAGIQTNFLFHK
ncbi:MAG: hypothetical protein ICV51_20225, partial [Flavisolibacter sp.]|nr:hypothetical protein [Flavisolibacter sp.]